MNLVTKSAIDFTASAVLSGGEIIDNFCLSKHIKNKYQDWRERQGQKVYVWNPAQPDGISHCYNPLQWISEKPGQMVDDVQKIANLIMPEQDFWQNDVPKPFGT